MKITKTLGGKESYDFTIDRRQFAKLISSAAGVDNKCGWWWIPTNDGKQLKLIVEHDE